ncbi:hypothetical protein JAAARDRAFT_121811 [Jaapia argillacea MUCL 33604]|uniref:FAD/NAD(P)-binding domain-containing protein n=1 Tax=Jaapia argillacea MUCL 33604 TaxID=933084 RepID=A0A067QF63_9AGAM|nr:hypothetical protein JAAARDRAFT_121811 [Jaapia argillacea MUCL 33604]
MYIPTKLLQTILSLSFFSTPTPPCLSVPPDVPPKSIAIVGGGTAGLAALKALLDLPEDVRQDWKIDLFEQRRDVGGIWLPDPNPPSPPELPETPLYPALRTNTPHPTMTYPHFCFPPLTPLYPSHQHVQAYHAQFAQHFNLTPHLHLQYAVLQASYSSSSRWTLTISNNFAIAENRTYDHLIVTSGHNHYPYEPPWEGKDEWLSHGNGTREILHSLWYREPERFKDRTVIVVGDAASGRDMAQQIVPFAHKLYHSFDDSSRRVNPQPPVPGSIRKPRISHFTPTSIEFTDNTTIHTSPSTPISILLGTGYELRIPFLSPSTLTVSPTINSSTTSLTTNLRYIRPLYRHILSLDSRMPTNALAFVGLPVWIANAPSDYAQGLFIAHAIANHGTWPTRQEMYRELEEVWEADLVEKGIDPFHNGHRFPTEGSAEDYQDSLITFLRSTSPIPLPPTTSNPYVESWRRRGRDAAFLMRRGWLRAETLGIEEEFIKGAVNEEDWARVMKRLEEWEAEEEGKEGFVSQFVDLPL